MSYPFNLAAGAILVEAVLTGPTASVKLSLVLDTGATASMVSAVRLQAAGLDLSQPTEVAQVTFGSGVQMLPIVKSSRLSALGASIADHKVVGHTLPASAGVDGVLGLDFFTGRVLTIDFVNNTLNLT